MREELRELQSVIDTQLGDRKVLKVLDAGCGRKGYKPYISTPEHANVVGIDVSEEELLKNTTANEKIVGDIQSYELPSSEFDAIICWWVLEHLPQPDRALDNFQRAVKEDGIVVLAVPNVFSIKGLLTKYTPYWFHIWYYRAILGYNHIPFKTFLRFSISPAAISRFAHKHGLSIAYSYLYSPGDTNKIFDTGVWLFRQFIKLLTLGRIDVGLQEFVIVLKKQRISVTDSGSQAADEVSANTK
jgi:2-polyprenyl-3-methyl-5-hydroxy-6-metoxy-1,4-benzoquinol methylase